MAEPLVGKYRFMARSDARDAGRKCHKAVPKKRKSSLVRSQR